MNNRDDAAVPEVRHFASDVSLLDLFLIVLSDWKLIAGVTIATSLLAVTYAISLPNIYASSTVLVGAEAAVSSPPPSGGLSSLATLAGINLGGSDSAKQRLAIEIMKSWAFSEALVKKYRLIPEIYASVGWDAKQGILYDEEIYNPASSEWLEGGDGESLEPSSWYVYKALRGSIEIAKDPATGFTTISAYHHSPNFAKKLVDIFVREINEEMRLSDKGQAESNIAFLKGKVQESTVSAIQASLYVLIEREMHTLMMASRSGGYVFKTVSEARVAEIKDSPKRALICIVGAMLGIFLGVVGVFFKRIFRAEKARQA